MPYLPGYQILGELGRGGMGVVYKARQITLDRLVALKMILSGGHASEDELARFRTEAEAVARLQHPGIVQIHEIGEHNGLPYFSLELCSGGSLQDRLDGTPLPALESARLVEQLARAMHAAHKRGVIHRDLKPANVLLADDDTPKITDFGLARKLDEMGRTATGSVMGTPSYMAPEQAEGKSKRVGPACDIYALGAILYECLTGLPPFKAATPLDTILQVVSEEPSPPRQLNPRIPIDLETICLKCLQKAPGDRYESAEALAEDLERFVHGDSIKVKRFGLVNRLTRMLERSHMENELRQWSNLLFFFAAVILLTQVIYCWQIQVGLPVWSRFATRAIQCLLMAGGLVWLHRDGFSPRTRAEQQLWSIWIGFILACTFATFANRMLFGPGKTFLHSLYPMWTAFSGMGFFALGSMYWGGCYVIGIPFFLLAVGMAWHIDWAPATFGLLWSAVLAWLAFHLRSLDPERS